MAMNIFATKNDSPSASAYPGIMSKKFGNPISTRSIPSHYVYSACETVILDDRQNTVTLLTAMLAAANTIAEAL